MQFRLVKVAGVDDAIISLFMSKRSYTCEKADNVRRTVAKYSDHAGFIHLPDNDTQETAQIRDWLENITKYGAQLGYKRNHETILRFIDFTVETVGLHKAGMGDLDAHAQRMNNRIVRSSSRLAEFASGEKSEFYDEKVMSVGEVISLMRESKAEVNIPETVEINGVDYRFNGFGYIRKGYCDDQDVIRGTYMLSIPSDSIWKADFIGMKHIYAMRNKHTHAHPELRDGMEQVAGQIEQALPIVGKAITNEWVNGEWVHVSETEFKKR
ncbi:MAG: hypothetical protein XD78_0885 [Desulfotomaculum sp. 46_296]|nr:MAG: hypothetical protein XD78_0885 [Desulfotomaculum sp. 46_296]